MPGPLRESVVSPLSQRFRVILNTSPGRVPGSSISTLSIKGWKRKGPEEGGNPGHVASSSTALVFRIQDSQRPLALYVAGL